MAYTPTQWSTGDTITAAKLNKIEDGIANSGDGVIITDNGSALNKTFAEIYNLINSGTLCFIKYNVDGSQANLDTDYFYNIKLLPIVTVYKYGTEYRVLASDIYGPVSVSNTPYLGTVAAWVYQASTSTGYPTFAYKVMTPNSNLERGTSR